MLGSTVFDSHSHSFRIKYWIKRGPQTEAKNIFKVFFVTASVAEEVYFRSPNCLILSINSPRTLLVPDLVTFCKSCYHDALTLLGCYRKQRPWLRLFSSIRCLPWAKMHFVFSCSVVLSGRLKYLDIKFRVLELSSVIFQCR